MSASDNDEIKMYFIVNSDLKMSKGKIAAQCSHATVKLIRQLEHLPTGPYKEWLKSGEAKIILKASETIMKDIASKYSKSIKCASVHDAGITEIPAGSFTVLAFEPIGPSRVPSELSDLKLL